MDADTDPILPDISATISDENEGETDLRHTVVERLLRFFLPRRQLLHNPFAEDVLAFIRKLAATLPPGLMSYPNSLLLCK